ncbi:MAG: hypothetical protein ABIU58_11015 [Ramlibacter sp.]
MKRKVTAFLVGANALLLCLLGWLWIDPQGGLRGIHWQAPDAIKPDLGGLSVGSLGREDVEAGRYVAILDRPLFYPGRRPAPVAKNGPARADPLDSIHLYGLFGGPQGGGVLVRVDGKSRRVKLSEALGDWNLKEIRGREVVFSRGAETRVVPLVQARQANAASGTPLGSAAGALGPGGAPGGFQFPFQLPPGINFPAAPMAVPPTASATLPAAISSPPAPSVGNATAPAPSNAKPAPPSSNPFVTGAAR